MFFLESKYLKDFDKEEFYLIVRNEDYFQFLLIKNCEILLLSEKFLSIDNLKKGIDTLKYHVIKGTFVEINRKMDSKQFYLVSNFNQIIFLSFIYKSSININDIIVKIKESYNNEQYEVLEIDLKELLKVDEMVYDFKNLVKNCLENNFVVVEEKQKYKFILFDLEKSILFESKKYSTKKILEKNKEIFVDSLKNGVTTIFKDLSEMYFLKLYSKNEKLLFFGFVFNSKIDCQNNLIKIMKSI